MDGSLVRLLRLTPGGPPGRPGEGAEPGGSVGLDDRTPAIRCPKCGWRPGRADRWQCSCGHLWNTFETRGVCPACAKIWTETCCLACLRWSPHEEWYERGGGASA
jgi:hypothetical protein